jgi:hypothetical protein
MSTQKIIHVYDADGGELGELEATILPSGKLQFSSTVSLSGLGATTAGVVDSAGKRLLTDAQEASLDAFAAVETSLVPLAAPGMVETLLGSKLGWNLNPAGAPPVSSTIITVPAATQYAVTRIVIVNADPQITTASIEFGINATLNSLVATKVYSELTGPGKYTVVKPVDGAPSASAGDLIKGTVTIKEGAPCVVDVYVYGYIV